MAPRRFFLAGEAIACKCGSEYSRKLFSCPACKLDNPERTYILSEEEFHICQDADMDNRGAGLCPPVVSVSSTNLEPRKTLEDYNKSSTPVWELQELAEDYNKTAIATLKKLQSQKNQDEDSRLVKVRLPDEVLQKIPSLKNWEKYYLKVSCSANQK